LKRGDWWLTDSWATRFKNETIHTRIRGREGGRERERERERTRTLNTSRGKASDTEETVQKKIRKSVDVMMVI
jgi:hypothetical protein